MNTVQFYQERRETLYYRLRDSVLRGEDTDALSRALQATQAALQATYRFDRVMEEVLRQATQVAAEIQDQVAQAYKEGFYAGTARHATATITSRILAFTRSCGMDEFPNVAYAVDRSQELADAAWKALEGETWQLTERP